MKITGLKNIKGFTLVEVMVATLITFIVMGGAYQTLTRETIDMERQEIILDMQNNARVAIDRITREIRRAGFFGCGGDLAVNALNNAGTDATQLDILTTATSPAADGETWKGSSSILTTLREMDPAEIDYLATPLAFNNNAATTHPLYAAGTDTLSLVYLGGDVPLDPTHALTADTSATKELELTRGAFAKGDILLITDCKNYSLFQKTNCGDTQRVRHTDADSCVSQDPDLTTTLNFDSNLGIAYGVMELARVYNLKISTFFIGTGDNANDLIYNKKGQTIASNIEDLQFEFITDTDNDGKLDDETWASTFDSAKPEDVRAIKVWVLAMSEVMQGAIQGSYSYAGKPPYTPNDNRYRYLTSSAVYLRNAGIN
jgi:type IV pilus assembly protein PilW